MSIVPKETIEVIAQSVGINNLSLDGALTLAPDVEYRMRELMQVSRCDFTWIGYFCLQCCHFRFLRRACFSVFFPGWVQEAIKCMRHSRRTILTTDDVDTALSIRNVEVRFLMLWMIGLNFIVFHKIKTLLSLITLLICLLTSVEVYFFSFSCFGVWKMFMVNFEFKLRWHCRSCLIC